MANEKPEPQKPEKPVIVHKRGWAWPLAVVVIAIMAFMFAGMIFAFSWWNGGYGFNGTDRFDMMNGRYGMHSWTTAGRDRLFGTVTSVSGDSFTVAGNGSSTTVKTDSSVQYTYGDQVKVNDSVLVYGTKDNGTLKASRIIINP